MSHKTWRNYIASQPHFNFKVTKQPLTATFTHPGLNYSHFDRDGMIDILSLMNYIIHVRTFPEHYRLKDNEERWFVWDGVLDGHTIFMSSIEIAMSPNMYNRQVPKWPLETKVLLGYVGNSSVAMQLELHIPGCPEPLLTHTVQMVVVNARTRRPIQFPDWFINRYKDQCSMKKGFRLDPFKRPNTTFAYSREVLWLETDKNNHTNFASYARYALDGVYQAIRQENQIEAARKSYHTGSSSCISCTSNDVSCTECPSPSADVKPDFQGVLGRSGRLHPVSGTVIQMQSSNSLRGITKDVLKRGLKSLKVCYVNECLEGDLIDVHVWQEESEAYTVRCSIEKGSQLICQIILEYFGPVSKL